MEKNKLQEYPLVTREAVEEAIGYAVQQVEGNLPLFKEKFKGPSSVNNFYIPSENVEWTTGFWSGEIWLAYEHTGREIFKEAGLAQVGSFLERIVQKIDVNHHDMGFLYSPSCVAAYKLVGDETGKKAALLAADNLISRFHEKGQFIQAWGDKGIADNYRLIIDCLLNLPLLYWATEVTGDKHYSEIARAHITTSLNNIMREDHSTYHAFFFDTETGLPLKGVTHQGYRDGSAWARGQAWGIYGVALSYKYTQDAEYINTFKAIADFFIDHLPEDLVPYWDFDFRDGSTEPKDSSSAAIAVCGMLEMSKYLGAEDSKYYKEVASRILKSLIDHYAVKTPQISNGQLLHGVYAKDSPYNTCTDVGVDECNTWGDYFYFEALTRSVKDWALYW